MKSNSLRFFWNINFLIFNKVKVWCELTTVNVSVQFHDLAVSAFLFWVYCHVILWCKHNWNCSHSFIKRKTDDKYNETRRCAFAHWYEVYLGCKNSLKQVLLNSDAKICCLSFTFIFPIFELVVLHIQIKITHLICSWILNFKKVKSGRPCRLNLIILVHICFVKNVWQNTTNQFFI